MEKREGEENFVHKSLVRESSNNNEKSWLKLPYIPFMRKYHIAIGLDRSFPCTDNSTRVCTDIA